MDAIYKGKHTQVTDLPRIQHLKYNLCVVLIQN